MGREEENGQGKREAEDGEEEKQPVLQAVPERQRDNVSHATSHSRWGPRSLHTVIPVHVHLVPWDLVCPRMVH